MSYVPQTIPFDAKFSNHNELNNASTNLLLVFG